MRNEIDYTPRARIPADVDTADKIVYGLTARQLAIVSVASAAPSVVASEGPRGGVSRALDDLSRRPSKALELSTLFPGDALSQAVAGGADERYAVNASGALGFRNTTITPRAPLALTA